MLEHRGRLLRAALGFAALPLPSIEPALSRRHLLKGTAATIVTIAARRTPAGANDSYKPHKGTEKYVRGQTLAVPFARSIDTNQITYADIRVLESETAITEAGPIVVVYARHGGIGNAGFSSILPQDRIVVVLIDSVRRLVIQDILPGAEFAARVNREIGIGSEQAVNSVTFTFISNIRSDALRRRGGDRKDGAE